MIPKMNISLLINCVPGKGLAWSGQRHQVPARRTLFKRNRLKTYKQSTNHSAKKKISPSTPQIAWVLAFGRLFGLSVRNDPTGAFQGGVLGGGVVSLDCNYFQLKPYFICVWVVSLGQPHHPSHKDKNGLQPKQK